jgi:hypothetical protein
MRIQFSSLQKSESAYTENDQKVRSSWILHERNLAKIEINNDVSIAKFEKRHFASDFVECYELNSSDRRSVRYKKNDDSEVAWTWFATQRIVFFKTKIRIRVLES